jgi:hypothetical protein
MWTMRLCETAASSWYGTLTTGSAESAAAAPTTPSAALSVTAAADVDNSAPDSNSRTAVRASDAGADADGL